MWNLKSPWNNKQNDTEPIPTMISSKLYKTNPKVTAAIFYSSSLIFTWCKSAQLPCLLWGSTDLQSLRICSVACCEPDVDIQGERLQGCAARLLGHAPIQLAKLGTGWPQRAGGATAPGCGSAPELWLTSWEKTALRMDFFSFGDC